MLGANETIARDNSPRQTNAGTTLRQFWRREDGTLMIFGLLLFVLMLTFGGIAVDIMRYEQRRTALQQTIDRSVLAAASLSQDRDPGGVVNDYFAKAGLSPYLRSVTVTEGLNFRNVNATAEADLNTFFMGMLGHEQLDVPAASTAEQRITNVEIVMVLDVSGSMSGDKIANLKTSAMEFVETVKSTDRDNRISIAIVPYNAQVNLPQAMREKYNATDVHGVADINCLELPDGVFSTYSLSQTTAIPMATFNDNTSSADKVNSYTSSNSSMVETNSFCRRNNDNLVRLLSGNKDTTKAAIDALDAGGNTSIVLGMKWGAALIDPASRPMISDMIAAGQADAAFEGRPFDWNDEDSMKIVIVMTDGAHVSHNRIKPGYKSGQSPIFRANDGNYSILHTANRPAVAGTNTYYVPHLSAWRATAHEGGGGSTRLDWPEVWQQKRVNWVIWQLYARALGTDSTTRNNWYNSMRSAMVGTFMSVSEMNTKLSQTCSQVKAKNVVVYGIAFEAPVEAQAVIKDCATSEAYYFDADGLEIQTAFRAIASNISQLRLTQ